MFKTPVLSTPLANEQASSYFKHITGKDYSGDVSFISTIRALVSPRMQNTDSLNLRFGRSNYTDTQVADHPTTNIVRAICSDMHSDMSGQIYVHNLFHTQESNYACLEVLKTTFEKVYKGWERIGKVTDFYRKKFYVMCFVNHEKKSAAIFVDRMDMQKMHYLQCSIFAFLPWYFNPEEGVGAVEMELINSLREKTSEKYEEVIGRIAKQYDFRSVHIKRMLDGFETKYEKIESQKVRAAISNVIEHINDLNRRMGDSLNEKNELEIRLMGLEKRIAQGSTDSEIMEYFLCNNNLFLFDVSNTTMVFGVKSYLTYYDEELALSAIENHDSYIYYPDEDDDSSECISENHMEKLMRAIFIDQTLKIKFCAAYEFDINGSVEPRLRYGFGNEFSDCMPNPHINEYQCMGNYTRTINELLKNRDYISAIEQCAASCKSLNFADYVVMENFVASLYTYHDSDVRRCIELPDGRVVTPDGAIDWILEQEAANEQNN